MAHLSQFSILALLNPMINEMSDVASAILLLICSHEVWVKVKHDWFTGCAYACGYVDPVFISQSHDISISTTTRRTNLSVFLVVMLMLMSIQFSLAYTGACAYVYAYALVKTGLKKGLIRQANKTSVLWRITNRSGLMIPVVYHFQWPTWTLQGLGLERKFAFKNCKNQFYFKGRETVSKHRTTGIKEIQLVSFLPGNASAPGNFLMEPNEKSQCFIYYPTRFCGNLSVKQWQ